MKGLFINQNVEFQLETKKETWCQGEIVDGILRVRNHGNANILLSELKVLIASGDFKKVKAKDVNSYTELISSVVASNIELQPKGMKEFSFSLKLGDDAPITDKGSSLYILYGDSKLKLIKMGQLQLIVNVHKHIGEVLKVFETFVRFKLNGLKAKGSVVEAKLLPPKNKQFALLDYLNLNLQLEGDVLKLKYKFSYRALGSEYAQIKVQLKKKDVKQELTKKDYSLYGDYPNHEGIKLKIEEVLNSEFKNQF